MKTNIIRAAGTAVLLLLPPTATAGIHFVTNTNDTGPGSLRDAMNLANADGVSPVAINFNVGAPFLDAAGVAVISPATPLPVIQNVNGFGIRIDGLTQPGSAVAPGNPSSLVIKVELDGGGVPDPGGATPSAHGLHIMSSGNWVQGLCLHSFPHDGISIEGIAPIPNSHPGANSNQIQWNLVGTDVNGLLARPNGHGAGNLWGGIYIKIPPGPGGRLANSNIVLENISSGNTVEGIGISNCPSGGCQVRLNQVERCYSGIDITGVSPLGNGNTGLYIGEGATDNVVEQNWIGANGFEGISIVGLTEPEIGTDGNLVRANRVGVDVALNPMGNGTHGVAIGSYDPTGYVGGHAQRNTVELNTIAYNGLTGVVVQEGPGLPDNASFNTITRNQIYYNGYNDPGYLGIDLQFEPGVTTNDPGDPDAGPNQLMNFPVITSAVYSAGGTPVTGTLDTPSPDTATVEVFTAIPDSTGSNYGQGAVYLGSATPDAAGNWITVVTAPPGTFVTATATDALGNTSEFSLNFPVEIQEDLDWGDAPDSAVAPGYPTLSSNGGANHLIVPGMYMGNSVDGESDGQQNATATGDDIAGWNDEDGVSFPVPLVPGQTGQIDIVASKPGWIDAWIDFDGIGAWSPVAEQIVGGIGSDHPGFGLTKSYTFPVPPGAVSGRTFARVRYSSGGGLLPTGGAQDGEVEDYEIDIEPGPQDELDFGDAPDAAAAPQYPTLLANNGARHGISAIVLGTAIDTEPDGQPTLYASGDDVLDGSDDEDGVSFPSSIVAGVPTTIQVSSASGGTLQGWVDWNGDGDWVDAGEQIITDFGLPAGTTTLGISVPSSATGGANGLTCARFRISSQNGIGYDGWVSDGEVEDYLIHLEPLKWLQIPEQGAEGVDVSNAQYMLADDFPCEESGPITDIHIWGSFLGDVLPEEGPGGLIFDISIWSDVPAGADPNPDIQYSHPGEKLWEKTFLPGQFNAGQIWEVLEGEWWHDPGSGVWTPGADHNIYQFDFYPPADEAFIQEEGTIYWLAIESRYEGTSDFQFGWKTTPEPWNDDACYFDPDSPPGPWKDLVYQPPHPWADPELEMQSVNLAFALSGGLGLDSDWGDAPDPSYPTLAANGGAAHSIDALFLGAWIDAETDGQPNATATGDDTDAGGNDDDGVTFLTPLIGGLTAELQVVVSTTGVLDAWIDTDGDGTWTQPNEQVVTGLVVNPGDGPITINVPPVTAPLWTFARFRVSHGGSSSGGFAAGGEVEDYQVPVGMRIKSTIALNWSVVPNQIVLNWTDDPAASGYSVYSSTNLRPFLPHPPHWALEASGIGTGVQTWSETFNPGLAPKKFFVLIAFP